jgi:hypothetical protein
MDDWATEVLERDPTEIQLRSVDRRRLRAVRDAVTTGCARTRLQRIDLRASQLLSFGMQVLLEMVDACCNLDTLLLGNCGLSSHNIVILSSALQHSRKLTHLDLIDNDCDDMAVLALCKLIDKSDRLHELWFTTQRANFGDETAQDLALAVWRNNSLYQIGCNRCLYSFDIKDCLLRNQQLRWKHVVRYVLDVAIALAPLRLPAYVALEIFDK